MFETLLATLIFLFPLAYSPGPGNIFFAANAARLGFRATIPANLGYHVAAFVVTFAIGLGFEITVAANSQVFSLIKIAGSLYVLKIAWNFFHAKASTNIKSKHSITVMDGVVLLILNPKAYVIIALLFSQFLERYQNHITAPLVSLTLLFTLNNAVAFTIWSIVGDKIAAHFRHETKARWLNTIFGSCLLLIAIWMLVS